MCGQAISDKDRKRAQRCLACPVCRRARKKRSGLCYWFVKHIEAGLCPWCRAYEKVYGRKAYEPVRQDDVN